jgi:myosin heavy subunit
MLVRMNANMNTMQEKADADRKADREDLKELMNAIQERMDANTKAMQEKMEEAERFSTVCNRGRQKDRQRRDETRNKSRPRTRARDNQKKSRKIEAVIQSIRSERDEMIQQRVENVVTRVIHKTQSLKKACLETTACHEATEADTEKTEPDPGMMRSMEEHQEIPKGEAAVMPVGGLRKRRRVQNLAAERRQKPKKRTRGYYGSRKKWPLPAEEMCPAVQEWHGEK